MNSGGWLELSQVRRVRGFTLLEIVVAVGVTALLATFMVAIVTNVTGFWTRTTGRLSAEAQARHSLDQLTLDLQSARFRDDGNTWLAATIPSDVTYSGGLWNNTGTTTTAVKPGNAAGSLQLIATGLLSEPGASGARFGVAGTWLRFFTTSRGSNLATDTNSAPVAVGYQIIRRASTATATNLDLRYLLHRTEVRPAASSAARSGTLQAGFDITDGAYQPGTNSAQPRDPAEIHYPTHNSVLAENVIDFGVRGYVSGPETTTGSRPLIQIFPSANNDLTHLAVLPAGVANAAGDYSNCFPDVVDVMLRVLTDEGARLIAAYEANPQRITSPAGRTPQQYWWDLAMANSQVFTRRIVLNTQSL